MENGEVTILSEAGERKVVRLSDLSDEDLAYIKKKTRRQEPAGSRAVLAAPIKKIDRMEPVGMAALISNPDKPFEVDGFQAKVAQLLVGGPEMNVGGFRPEQGFGFAVLQIRMTAKQAPAETDVYGFYLESPQGSRYPVHLLVIPSPDGRDGKRTLRGVEQMRFVAATDEAVIDNTYVFLIPAGADVKKFRLGFAVPEKSAVKRERSASASARGSEEG